MTPSATKTSVQRRGLAVWLATGLGVGYGPVMPGTYGSVLGVGLYLVLVLLLRTLSHPLWILCLATVAIIFISIQIVAVALRSFRSQDPSQVVLDEVAGQLLTLLPLPILPHHSGRYWTAIVIGFVLFRAFDTIKPYPIWKLERLGGAWGVVADDVGAGVLAALVLEMIARFWLHL